MNRESVIRKIKGILAEWGDTGLPCFMEKGYDPPMQVFYDKGNYSLVEKIRRNEVVIMQYIDDLAFGSDSYDYSELSDEALADTLLIVEDYGAMMWSVASKEKEYDH